MTYFSPIFNGALFGDRQKKVCRFHVFFLFYFPIILSSVSFQPDFLQKRKVAVDFPYTRSPIRKANFFHFDCSRCSCSALMSMCDFWILRRSKEAKKQEEKNNNVWTGPWEFFFSFVFHFQCYQQALNARINQRQNKAFVHQKRENDRLLILRF